MVSLKIFIMSFGGGFHYKYLDISDGPSLSLNALDNIR